MPFYPGLAFGLVDLKNGKPELDNVIMPELESVHLKMALLSSKRTKTLILNTHCLSLQRLHEQLDK